MDVRLDSRPATPLADAGVRPLAGVETPVVDVEEAPRSGFLALIRDRGRRPMVIRAVKYTLGSVVATLVSLVTFVVVYGAIGVLSPRQSSIVASLVGMVPAYFLNRNWAWGRRGRSHLLKEVAPYLAASVTGLLAAMWSVSYTSSHVESVTDEQTLQVALVALAYLGAYGSLWVLKFLFFNVLFSPRTQGRRSAAVASPD